MRQRRVTDDEVETTASGADASTIATLERPEEQKPPAAKKGLSMQSILQFELTPKRVKRKDLMHFSRQLAVFVRAGIPLLEALEAIAEETGSKKLREVLNSISEDLKNGSTLSAACAKWPESFPPYYLGILQSAELTGKLDTALDQLSEYIERDLESRRKITAALTYPAVVVGLSVIVVVVLTGYVLPKFETFFDSLDAKLPLATRMLLSFGHFVSTWWWLILSIFAAILIGIAVAVRTEKGRVVRDKVLLRTPVLGDVIQHALLERFCRVLSSLVHAGVTLPEALAVTTEAVNNRVFRRGITDARTAMLRGEGLARPLAQTGLFPAAARQMFAVGETTGTLDDQLSTAAVFFDRELDYKIKRFTTMFEPAVLVFVGVIVGFVAIALVSAMYGIFRQVRI